MSPKIYKQKRYIAIMQKELLIQYWRENYDFTEKEIGAFRAVNRENFVLEEHESSAYEDTPLPILREKTISQPTTVMIMTHALELKENDKVFEVGSGSGYQTALIAKLIGKGKVISTEVIPELVIFAKKNLRDSDIYNIEIHERDGAKGFDEEAPFDKIIITAACKDFPPHLIDQLKPHGIIVAPIGNEENQMMVKAIKKENNDLEYEFLGPFLFSPLYGDYGFEV